MDTTELIQQIESLNEVENCEVLADEIHTVDLKINFKGSGFTVSTLMAIQLVSRFINIYPLKPGSIRIYFPR